MATSYWKFYLVRAVPIIIFMALDCIGLSSCSKSTNADPTEKYLGTYFVKRNTEIISEGTGNHFFSKDSFLITITKSIINSEIKLSSQDNWIATVDKNNFIIIPYKTKQLYGILYPSQTYITGFGKFSGDSILYNENLNGGIDVYSGSNEVPIGRNKLIGVKQ